MEKEVIEKAAEILVKTGYAEAGYDDYPNMTRNPDGSVWVQKIKGISCWTFVRFHRDTLEDRRQADAIENYFRGTDTHTRLIWQKAVGAGEFKYGDCHQWRLEVIKRCLEQLTKDGE